jgi:hypothetical protein
MLYKTRKELDNALAFRQAHYPWRWRIPPEE